MEFYHDDVDESRHGGNRRRKGTGTPGTFEDGAAEIKEIITGLSEERTNEMLVQQQLEIVQQEKDDEEDKAKGYTFRRLCRTFFRKLFITLEDSSYSFVAKIAFWITTLAIFVAILNYLISTESIVNYQPETCDNPVCNNDPFACPDRMVIIIHIFLFIPSLLCSSFHFVSLHFLSLSSHNTHTLSHNNARCARQSLLTLVVELTKFAYTYSQSSMACA